MSNKLLKEEMSVSTLDRLCCLAEIGEVSPGLFHDVLNPISSLVLSLDIIKKQDYVDGRLNQYLSPIIKSSQKVIEFIRIIQKDFSSAQEENICLSNITNQVMKMLSHRAILQNTTLIFTQTKVSKIKSRKVKMYQIALNLISNAIDSFEQVKDERRRIVNIKITQKNQVITLRVADNGCGISENNLKKIFNIDYTTKKNGTGIGLSSTRKIIEKDLKGAIKYKSKINKGTVCTITIPTKNH